MSDWNQLWELFKVCGIVLGAFVVSGLAVVGATLVVVAVRSRIDYGKWPWET